MKKFLLSIIALCLFGFVSVAKAEEQLLEWEDVKTTHWAYPAIYDVVTHDVMSVNELNYFNPTGTIKRIEFLQSLLKVLSNDNLDVTIQNEFSDIQESDSYYADVLRSQQLGIAYGYPDGEFKPNRLLIKSEVTSLMSHITKDVYTDFSIVDDFTDKDLIPNWAKVPYAKTTYYDLFVNYPDPLQFEPSRDLTRAEAAVLLAKLRTKLGIVKEQYKGATEEPETLIATEHLGVTDKAPVNTVQITNKRKIVDEGNVLLVRLNDKVWSKTANIGDVLNFDVDEDVYTVEGTLVFPAGTKFTAQVVEIKDPEWMNKNARVGLLFQSVEFTNGEVKTFAARPFTRDGYLKEGPWMTAGKLALSTAVGGGAGTGAGLALGTIPDPNKLGQGVAIGTPIGCGLGLALGLVTPGLHYKGNVGDEIYVIITEALSIYNNL